MSPINMFCTYTAEQITRGVSKHFGLPFDLDYIAPFYVIPAFNTSLDRVLSAIKCTLEEKRFDAAPLVPILATLMLHFVEEWEVFAGLSHLVQRHGWIDHTHSQLATSSNMLLSLLNTHMVTTTCQCKCADDSWYAYCMYRSLRCSPCRGSSRTQCPWIHF